MLIYNQTSGQSSTTSLFFNISTRAERLGDNETTQPSPTATVLCNNATDSMAGNTRTSNDALLYIVTVLLFYSLSMVILMIKYIRREREEAEMAHYYSEFVSRDKFKTPKFELQNYMKLLKYKQEYLSERSKAVSSKQGIECVNVPLVTYSRQADEQVPAEDEPLPAKDEVDI